MTSSRVANELASILVPIGTVGAVLAAICAIVAGIAIMRGAAGLVGGAVGLWIPSAMLSSTASFASQWLPLVIAGASLVAMLIIGAIGRAALGAGAPAREAARTARAQALADAPETVAAPRGTVAPSTGSQPALAG